jgi:hypothetical protein
MPVEERTFARPAPSIVIQYSVIFEMQEPSDNHIASLHGENDCLCDREKLDNLFDSEARLGFQISNRKSVLVLVQLTSLTCAVPDQKF